MRLMGHSSVTVSRRYVHPTPHVLERDEEQLEGLNWKAENDGYPLQFLLHHEGKGP